MNALNLIFPPFGNENSIILPIANKKVVNIQGYSSQAPQSVNANSQVDIIPYTDENTVYLLDCIFSMYTTVTTNRFTVRTRSTLNANGIAFSPQVFKSNVGTNDYSHLLQFKGFLYQLGLFNHGTPGITVNYSAFGYKLTLANL